MRSRWIILAALAVAVMLVGSPGTATEEATVAVEAPAISVAPAASGADSGSWLSADPFFGSSEFSTAVGEPATCTLCKSKICQHNGPCPGRQQPDPLNCKCRTCNGEFNCWQG